MNLAWAIEKLNARVVGDSANVPVIGVCTDTRRLKPGDLFFALAGEQADGHDYVARALANGAVAAVVSRVPNELAEGGTGTLLVVPDTLRAFGDLAMHYRRQFAIPVIGVTGSVGKTSTKEMIAAVLRTHWNTLASEKNYNNEIGVPQTLFQLTPEHEAAVIEMGMRGLGQIDRLAEIAEPTVGLITNIGTAHIELLGSQENIARAKSELFARLPANGTAIMGDVGAYAHLLEEKVPEGCRILTFTAARLSADIRMGVFPQALQIDAGGCITFRFCAGKSDTEYSVRLQAVGTHHLTNSLVALAVAYALDIPIPEAITALEAWQGAEGRMVVRHTPNGITVLDDCYNASPESMYSALNTLERIGKSRVAVLGDMKELGEFAPGVHSDLGVPVVMIGAKLLVTVGDETKAIAERARKTMPKLPSKFAHLEFAHFATSAEAAAHINALVAPGDTVLVKGSRAMGMEVIVAALMGETATESTNAHG